MSNKPKAPFSEQNLIDKWNAFGKALQSEGLLNVASIILANKPVLQDKNIVFSLTSHLMLSQFTSIKPRLLNFLRKELNNYGVSIETHILKQDKKTYVYTPQEKFNKLAAVNPDILYLKKVFNLEI